MNNKENKHKIKIIDVEALDDAYDNQGGPIDMVDIFDNVTEGNPSKSDKMLNKRLEDIANPLNDEDADVLQENLYESEPDKSEAE